MSRDDGAYLSYSFPADGGFQIMLNYRDSRHRLQIRRFIIPAGEFMFVRGILFDVDLVKAIHLACVGSDGYSFEYVVDKVREVNKLTISHKTWTHLFDSSYELFSG